MFEPLCKTTGAPDALSFFTGSISIVLMLINIPGNLLVILAVTFDPNKNLRNSFNFLVTNLAIADLVVGLVTDPLSIHIHFKEGRNQDISKAEIQAIHMSYFISCTASVLSIILLACDRYLALVHPARHCLLMNRPALLGCIALIWVISIGLPCIYFEVGYIRYAFIFANTAVVIAIIVTVFTYTRLIMKFHSAGRSSTEDTNGELAPSSPTALTPPSHNDQKRITEMFMVILIAVLCCYVPSTILIYAMNFCESCTCDEIHTFRDLQFVFVIANSSVNFFCYAFRSPKFRSAFKVILRLQQAGEENEDVNMHTVEKGVTEVTDNKV
ncbi:adrenocorticotropic hormone receptor-like [Dendronephthya gigantea]|uniref:adrenocorticotropic hormone receptor-like n=1 Tax=Dendronephthya gigantea TaxID=151771 RepID=UPI001069C1E0|nr:adrenocorticotropic hormone receptor-like [Dendronephthya gigantea]